MADVHRLALAVLLLLAIGCGEAIDADGGAAGRTDAARDAEAQRNLAASQTAQPHATTAPRP